VFAFCFKELAVFVWESTFTQKGTNSLSLELVPFVLLIVLTALFWFIQDLDMVLRGRFFVCLHITDFPA
jgi:hypothetical protein